MVVWMATRGGAVTDHDVQKRIDLIKANDRVIRLFGMEVDAAAEGVARVSAIVSEEVLNHHELAHGAFVFAVADVAFALAVNSVTDSVAVQWSLNLFRPALLGERITADCSVIHRGRRLLVVELEVHNSAGKLLAKGEATALPVGKDSSPSDPSSKVPAATDSPARDPVEER